MIWKTSITGASRRDIRGTKMSNGLASAITICEAWDKKVRRRLNVARSMGMICVIGGCVLSCPVADGSKDAVVVMVDAIVQLWSSWYIVPGSSCVKCMCAAIKSNLYSCREPHEIQCTRQRSDAPCEDLCNVLMEEVSRSTDWAWLRAVTEWSLKAETLDLKTSSLPLPCQGPIHLIRVHLRIRVPVSEGH